KPKPLTEEEWLKAVGAMPPEKQVEAVVARLKERNPGFDGKETHKIEGGVVTELGFLSDHVTDISPVRVLTGLRTLLCSGTILHYDLGKGQLADLSPVKNLKLTSLLCGGTQVTDLSPLKDMKLTKLYCHNTQVSDLTPLKDMMLKLLNCNHTKVADLTPLKDMKLTYLNCNHTKVTDLSPLKGMPL